MSPSAIPIEAEKGILIADLHVHLYPNFSFEKAFRAAFSNLGRLLADHVDLSQKQRVGKALFLTERSDCYVFETLASLQSEGEFRFEEGGEGCVKVFSEDDELYVVQGRQIATAERLEILALGIDPSIPDGVSLDEGVEAVIEAGGIPVIPWSLGKWWFERGKIVRNYLQTRQGEPFPLLGDIPMRCTGGSLTQKLRTSRRVICGSDPLPLKGEEGSIGSFASIFEGVVRHEQPRRSLLEAVCAEAELRVAAGRRNSPLEALSRLQRLKRGR